MYLKTPKRYTKTGRRRSISLRFWWLYVLTGVSVLVAYAVWENRAPLRQQVGDIIATAEHQVATMAAPTPTPSADPMLCLSRANAAYEAGNLGRAIEYYQCAATGMPNDANVHYQLAFMLIVTGQVQEGLEAARRTILADPLAPEGYAITGMGLDWVGSETRQEEPYGEALAYVLRALDIDENFADGYAFLSEVYTDQGRIDDAYQAAEEALELDPDNFKAHRNYGYALQVQGYYEEAAAHFEQAVRLRPKLPYARIQLAQMYFALDRVNDAMDLLLQAVQITGGDPESYYWLGHGYLVYQGNHPAARSNWETCVEVDPTYRPCWERLGGLLLYLQEYEHAANAYAHAIDLGSTKPEIYYYAALVNQLIGRCDKAIGYARRGFELGNLRPQDEENLREVLNDCRAVPLETMSPDEGS